jgi:hypothetical protein
LGGEKTCGVTGSRNLRSVWTITTKPCKEAHFATFPPDIPERCIKAATSERGVCPKCGKQWERVTEKMHDSAHDGKTASDYPAGTTANRLALLRQQARENGGEFMQAVKTTGWRPGCECGLEPIPANVLDPFGGAGTVGMVAARLGRSSVSIELNPAYCEIARKRIEAATRQQRLELAAP